jgi:hypothetical protein
MADDKTRSGGQDRTRIDTDQEYEARDWPSDSASVPISCALP